MAGSTRKSGSASCSPDARQQRVNHLGDTIVALSSGALPAGIAVVRSSGPHAFAVARALVGDLPPARTASLRHLRDPADGSLIDRALVIIFPGPRTATGEDLVEYHCHGGRATVAALLDVLRNQPGVRDAEPGEFTRRALANGMIDLTAAEGVADLLAAETELQRKIALRRTEGSVRRQVDRIREALLDLAAAVELAIDYVDEDDGQAIEVAPARYTSLLTLLSEILAATPAERLRDGIRVVVAGPPNAGKSSLINCLAQEERAIVTDIAGTTRDVIEVPLRIAGLPIILTDTAGLRDAEETVERIGIARAEQALASADLILWLGDPAAAPKNAIQVGAKADLRRPLGGIPFSAVTGLGREELLAVIVQRASFMLPGESDIVLSGRERTAMALVAELIEQAANAASLEISADYLQKARSSLDAITGHAGVDDMLEALFSRFCVGK